MMKTGRNSSATETVLVNEEEPPGSPAGPVTRCEGSPPDKQPLLTALKEAGFIICGIKKKGKKTVITIVDRNGV
jgi:hypothetical protein